MAASAPKSTPESSVHEQLVKAMQAWVERHPNPDAPALSVAGGGQFTPRQLLEQVLERSDTGLFFEELVETTAANSQVKLDEILRWFERGEERAFSREYRSYEF